MRQLLTILGFICAILGLALSILPFNKLALIPLSLAFILSLIVMRQVKNENKSTLPLRIVLLLTIVGLFLSVYRTIFDTNEVAQIEESIEREKQSEEDAIKELEDIEIDE